MVDRELNDRIRLAIDDIDMSVRINGKQSDITDSLVNYLTANIDDIAESISFDDEEDDTCGWCMMHMSQCACGLEEEEF